MKDNKANSHAGNNGEFTSDEQSKADSFVEALETEPRLVDSLDDESRGVQQFGSAMRELADNDLPASNLRLHELLAAKLADEELSGLSAPVKQMTVKHSQLRTKRWALVASLLLALGVVGLLLQNSAVEPVLSSGLVEDVEPDVVELKGSVDSLSSIRLPQTENGVKPGNGDGEMSVADASRPENNESRVELSESGAMSKSGPGDDGKEQDQTVRFATKPNANPSSANPHPADVSGTRTENGRRQLGAGSTMNYSGALKAMPGSLQSTSGVVAGAIIENNSNGVIVGSGGGGFGGGGLGGGGLGGGGGGLGGRGLGYDGRFDGQSRRRAYYYEGKRKNIEAHGRFESRNGQAKFGYFERGLSGEQYDSIHENSFEKVAGNKALSTFSIDVDTASYANVRRYLNSNQRPPRNAVRIEELVNYFKYDYPQPEGEHPFSVNMELASCPWNEQHHLLRVGLKGKEVHREERSDSNLVFLLDVSGSMNNANKLPLLKQGLLMMIQQLSENDSVSIVTYAGNAGVVLEPTNGANKRNIEQAIENLSAGGSTNGSAGIELAYQLAQKQFIKDGSNRVILATDGDLNVGVTGDQALVDLIKQKSSEGVYLTVLGFGTGNLKDSKLEKLADNGNGMYAYIDSFREAHKVLIEQMSGSLETIAKDVKLQLEFNPSEVVSYRLIGYENRMLAAQDFDNDKKDAGEIGAGHTVTALYELVLADGGNAAASTLSRPLKYQSTDESAPKDVEPKQDSGGHQGELLTLSLRYKKPDENTSKKIEFTLKDEPTSFSSASKDFQFAASVASFGMILRGSEHRGSASLPWVLKTAAKAIGNDESGYRYEFLDLVRKASSNQ